MCNINVPNITFKNCFFIHVHNNIIMILFFHATHGHFILKKSLILVPLASSSPVAASSGYPVESPSLVLVINDTKLLMTCVKCFELGISNTCDEGVLARSGGHKITKRWCMDMK
jgi:hypothetical protein